MIWGYAGVFRGDTNVHKGDATMNRLRWTVAHGFKSAPFPLCEIKDPARRDQIARFVADHDLQLTVHFGISRVGCARDEIRRATDDFLSDLEAYGELLRVPIVHTAAGGVHRFLAEPSREKQLDWLAANLAPLAQGCHDLGRPLGIENHGDYYCSDLVELCQRTPHLGIFLDTGNCFLIGEPPLPACRQAAPFVIGGHFKDHTVAPDADTLAFRLQGAVLGHGHVGLGEIWRDLMTRAANPGKLVLQWELIPPKEIGTEAAVEKSWEFVRSLEEPPR